jgi:hypothetical protein
MNASSGVVRDDKQNPDHDGGLEAASVGGSLVYRCGSCRLLAIFGCRDVQLESVMRVKAAFADAYPGQPSNLPPPGGGALFISRMIGAKQTLPGRAVIAARPFQCSALCLGYSSCMATKSAVCVP